MQSDDCLEVMKKIWKSGHGAALSSHGALGGIVTWWDATSFKLISKIESCHWLFVELEDINTQEILWIGNVYGPTLHGQKEEFWDQLDSQKHWKL